MPCTGEAATCPDSEARQKSGICEESISLLAALKYVSLNLTPCGVGHSPARSSLRSPTQMRTHVRAAPYGSGPRILPEDATATAASAHG